jgi:hypothetical protein
MTVECVLQRYMQAPLFQLFIPVFIALIAAELYRQKLSCLNCVSVK